MNGAPSRAARPGASAIDAKTIAALVVTLLLWGTAFPAIRACLPRFSPGHLALLRFLSASAVLLVIAVVAHVGIPRRSDLVALVISGFTGVAGYHMCLNYGMVTVSSGVGSVLANTSPVFTALFAAAFLGERLGARGWLGTVVSFVGVALIAVARIGPVHLDPRMALPLVSAIFWSMQMVVQKPLLTRYTALQVTTYGVLLGTAMLLVLAPGMGTELRAAPLSVTVLGVYLGVGPVAVAYCTWAYTLSRLDASVASTALYLIPVESFVIGWLWLGEAPALLTVVGGVVVILGIATVRSRER